VNENSGWQPPGYQPSLSRRTTALDAWPGLPPSSEPTRRRGNLLALALVVGLLAFFVADALPSGPNVVATFFVATAAVLVLFLLAVAVALIVRRSRRDAPSPLDSLAVPGRRVPPRDRHAARAAAADAEEVIRPALPGSRQHFLKTVDELLAAVDAMPEYQGREIEEELLRFATSADVVDLVELIERRVPEIQRFVILAERLTKSQLRYLSVVLKARKVLR
jgi:uncharacterized membrane protein